MASRKKSGEGGYSWEQDYFVSVREAEIELKKHGATLAEFQKEVGKRDSYKATTVLRWLGY